MAGNLTAVAPTSSGQLEVFPTGVPPTGAGTLLFQTGQVRANNGILPLGLGGEISVRPTLSAADTVHFVLDVSGYFR